MSIATEITRLQNAKASLKTSINAKNDSQHQITTETIDDYANFVDSIQTGGGTPNLQNKSVEITTNTITTITADSGYDGLSSVSVTTNVPTQGTPEKGIVIQEYDSNGYATKMKVVGFNNLQKNALEYTKYGLLGLNLNTIDLSECSNVYGYALRECSRIHNVILSQNIRIIYGYTFQNCTNLTNINLDNITSINTTAFSQCISLALSSLPDTITSIGGTNIQPGETTSTTGSTFAGCNNLTLSKLPDNLTSLIGGSNFQNCSKCTFETFPDGLSNFTGISNFRGCQGIKKFNTNNAITMPQSTFASCSNMYSVILPKVTTINGTSTNNGAFYGCSKLKGVWIGDSITSANFSRYAFKNCNALIKMYINLPRATVEAFTNYQYAFMDDTTKTGIIVCNDDNDFITQTQFEAIDWETYTE